MSEPATDVSEPDTDGPDAADGPDAPDGPDAVDGPDGPDGSDGPDGPDGSDGPDGPEGVQAVRAAIGLGTNVGDRLGTVEAAVWTLDETAGMDVVDVSGVYETMPWGGVDQDPYLNAVVLVDTTLSPHALLADLQATEAAFDRDRDREVRWGPRTLDLDVLLYGDEVVDTPDLVVPHPRLHERAFVLVPLLEVLPGGRLPDGTRLTAAMNALAPIGGVDLHVRLSDHPGRQRIQRPRGPSGGRPWLGTAGDGHGDHSDLS